MILTRVSLLGTSGLAAAPFNIFFCENIFFNQPLCLLILELIDFVSVVTFPNFINLNQTK